MNKVIGYSIAVVGLVILVFSTTISKLPVISGIKNILIYLLGAGIVIAGVGIAMTLTRSSQKIEHITEEVPIYIGEGKERRIVGYRKASK